MTAQPSRDLSRLTEEQQERLRVLLRSQNGGEGLDAFIRRISPHHPPPRHFAPMVAEFERAKREPGKVKVCFSLPPRHGKTSLVQHAFAWWLDRSPADTCAYASYSDTQSWSKIGAAHSLCLAAGVQQGDRATMAEWRTAQGGGILAAGAGGGLTGQGVSGIMVVDDPFKNSEEASSTVIRDKVGDWFDSVPMTRTEGCSFFVIHTRWHEDDLIGRLEKLGEFKIINLPAIADPGDPLGRIEGAALWPDRFGLDFLNAQKKRNAYVFASLYQGRPVARGSRLFGVPHYFDPKTVDLTGCEIVIVIDPAGTEKTSSDYSAILVLAVKGTDPATRVGYVLRVVRMQTTIPHLVQIARGVQKEFGNAPIHVEAVGGFKAVPQMLRDIDPTLIVKELPTVGDKLLRAQPAASAWNDDPARILVPFEAEWLPEFLLELSVFTGVKDRYDDQVDALAHAWSAAAKGAPEYTGRTLRSPRRM